MSVLTREEAKNKITALKNAGKRIVLTNGCFDILHVGHVRYMKEAKALGDVLIVGINSDESVKRLKGENRPIVPQNERAEMLDALETVDYVVIFDEDTPEEIIRELRPNIQAKGGDYKESDVIETKALDEYGGELKILQLVDGASTTNILEKIRKGSRE
jgi:glycerol-3-phosphate cytidylyltransferase